MRWLHVPHLKESGRPMWCGNHSRMQAVQILGCMQEERMQPTLRTYHHSCTQKKMRPDSLWGLPRVLLSSNTLWLCYGTADRNPWGQEPQCGTVMLVALAKTYLRSQSPTQNPCKSCNTKISLYFWCDTIWCLKFDVQNPGNSIGILHCQNIHDSRWFWCQLPYTGRILDV